MPTIFQYYSLPTPAVLRISRNTAFLWATGRLAVHFAGVSARPVIGSVLVVLVVVVLMRLEMRRFRELWLLRNMGISPLVPLVVAAVAATVLETVLWTVLFLRGVYE